MKKKNLKTVEYKHDGGLVTEDALVLIEAGPTALLLLSPTEKGQCGCLVMARLNSVINLYESIGWDSWVNIPSCQSELDKIIQALNDNRLYKKEKGKRKK